ncbi:von Willebrand domain containing protein [Cordyceps fumosorosea ARSEF 2679]|uniref:von Willebrand domain containing protein n=1 Tax=Cordyceps fumosorosea (strain ARSEF 2679) TaxID=1081104 RepID=A0A167N4A9_CORFA|nr:von Willebrand domain containing protein [Cordyceps fumosorosea ARSEF 2679]OAA55113.1 von Willebrand domain containing protein [Cordyceps fumosorosea ARSEF 2679]
MSPFWRPPLYPGISAGYCGCIVIVKNERKYLPLTHVSAHATLLASTSRTTLTQTFKNPTSETIKESRYVFPLFDGVSVVTFTCTIGTTVIKGIVKSKPEAKKEFDAAVARGEQAGLLEQSDRASDVFTTSLGNVGPNEEAKVEITFLGELKHDAEVDGLRYTIPTSIAPRYADDLVLPIPVNQSNVTTADASFGVTVDVDLATGAAIKSVQSPSHPISVNIGTTSTQANEDPSLQCASASLTRTEVALDKDFIVQVCAKGLGDPSAVLETHATIPGRRAVMATLVPRFNLAAETPEVVFICDRSGSMDTGTRLPNLVAALQVFLRSLPVGVLFNICSFGSTHSFLWPKSQPYNQTTLDQAAKHVSGFKADFGGTMIREPIEATFANRDSSRNLEVFLMTDGETWDEQATFDAVNQAVEEAKGAIRLFALGVGADVSHSLIEGVARAGRGFTQSVGENENMSKKVVRMLKGALTPHVNDYSLEIKYEKGEDDDDDEFELVEKVNECTIVDSVEEPAKKPISLHDTSVKNEDLEMPDAKEKELPLPTLPTPTYLQAPYTIPPLFPFTRTTVYVLLSEARANHTPKSVVLRGTAPQGPLTLEIPIVAVDAKGTTVHQLAARKAVQDLEEGRGWVRDAKLKEGGKPLREVYAMRMTDVAKEAAVKLGVEYQVAGKWCSFVAVKKVTGKSVAPAEGSKSDDKVDEEEEYEDVGFGFMDDSGEAAKQQHAGPRFAKRSMMQPMAAMRMRSAAPMPAAPVAFGGAPVGPSAPSFYALDTGSNSGALFGSGSAAPPPPPPQSASAFSAFSAPAPQASAAPPGGAFGGAAAGDPRESLSGPEEKKKKSTPLEAIIALQTFGGSWTWSAELETLLGGVTPESAGERLGVESEAAATLCTVAYLRAKMADEEEVWELVVDKARAWLATTLAMGEDEMAALEGKARELVGS